METYQDLSITFRESDMILCIALDSSYLSVTGARSLVRGVHFLGNQPDDKIPLNQQQPIVNALIYVEASILRHVMGSASETEIAGGYVNARKGIEFRITLMEMKHFQQQTPLELDNTTACGILTK